MEQRREVLVGLVVVVGLAIGLFGTIWLQGGWSRDQLALRAASPNAGQLVAGGSVKFRGVQVGRVSSVAVVPSGEAVMVEMTVMPDLVLPSDPAMLIAPESFFGDWQAEIVNRSEHTEQLFLEYPEEGVLPGAALTDFSRLTATAEEIAGNLTTISQRFEIAFTEETALNLKAAIDNISRVSDGLSAIVSQQSERFDELAAGVGESAAEIAALAREAREAIQKADEMLADAELRTVIKDAGTSVANLRAMSEDMVAAMDDIRESAQQATATMDRLEDLVVAAETGEGLLGNLLGDKELAGETADAIARLNALLADIQENPRRYLSFSVF
ncbi:MAG: MlaD family protein [Gemmatimonadetes bacterium]|nr:MlaD family protein [Gemmatimonadota bacterium]MCY3942696.1 MlaD family protein [Gemmatimonadota bacterium]